MEQKLNELRKIQPDYKHTDEMLNIKDWIKVGKPKMWRKEDSYKDYSLFRDIGYGQLALFKGDKLINCGTDIVCNEDHTVIGLSRYYTDGFADTAIYLKRNFVEQDQKNENTCPKC